MVMARALCSAMLLLALAAPVSSTPEIPTEFFEAQNRAGAEGRFASRRVHFEESFRSWMAEHGVTFGTKGEFERRLRIFAANRYGNRRALPSCLGVPSVDPSCRNCRFRRTSQRQKATSLKLTVLRFP